MISSCKKCWNEIGNDNESHYCEKCLPEFLQHIKDNYSKYALRAGVPRFYHEVTFDAMTKDNNNKEGIRAAIRMIEGGGFLLLHGDTGTGKTWIASALAKEILISGRKVFFTRAIDFFNAVRKGYKDKAKIDADDILRNYKKLPFLIFDDLGSEKFTDWIEETVYNLVDYRHGGVELPTLITSNLNNAQISERYGARVARRIKQVGPRIELKGGDRS